MSSPPAEPPATVTADTTGTATVAVETAGTGVEHVAVSVNDGPPMWVPVVGGTGAIQVAVSAGDEITAAGAEHIEIVVEGD